MNGILKQEYFLGGCFRTKPQAITAIDQAVMLYNTRRPHLMLKYNTPAEVHEKQKIAAIKLSQIVIAIDGDKIFNSCGLGLDTCDENHPCPVHDKFKIVRDNLKNMLEQTNLEELALDIKSGVSFLKI